MYGEFSPTLNGRIVISEEGGALLQVYIFSRSAR